MSFQSELASGVGVHVEGARGLLPGDIFISMSPQPPFPCSPHGLLLWLAEINVVNIFDCTAVHDSQIFKRIKHSQ